jgi:hypothetical protein
MENRTFSQRVSDETLGSGDGFMRVLNHDTLDRPQADELQNLQLIPSTVRMLDSYKNLTDVLKR